MRASLKKIPLWGSVALLGGVVFGLAMGFYTKYDGASTRFAVVGGVLTGLSFGLVTALACRRLIRRWQDALGDIPSPVRRAADRALWRWRPVPADPEVRAAAIKVAEYRLAQLVVWRSRSLVLWGILLALSILLLVRDVSLWRIFDVLVFVFFLSQQFYAPRALRRRIEVLEGG
ncbi:hypothetical protein AB0P21_37600 [Kribbella sp. NPDC056861]|uniref:hypothetical protein n=1 Tax=Kribbella sp. NPDC056861 TaxID=3154857 RepID=UPI00343BAB71